MPYLRDYHIFISHSWEYSNQYNTIKDWLDDEMFLAWSDYSVPIERPLLYGSKRELEEKITDKIAHCSCVIILSGMYVNYSDWIDFEIDTAVKLGKPIIGVKPWGNERIPAKVQIWADTIVGWNSNSLISAIRRYSL